MNDIFYKYIPKFEYELVSLKEYSFEDLAKFGNAMSMFMIVDKLKTAEAFSELGKLRQDYGKQLDRMNIPKHLKELLVKVFYLCNSVPDSSGVIKFESGVIKRKADVTIVNPAVRLPV